MYSVIVILAVIVAILLILIVLIQESKGGGLASSFAGSNVLLGVRKTTDFIEKATWTLAGALVVLSVATVFFSPKADNASRIVTDMKTTLPTQTLPGQNNQQGGAQAPAQQQAPAKK